MKPYVVADSIIDMIICAAVKLKVQCRANGVFPAAAINLQNATAIGRILLTENIRSVEATDTGLSPAMQ